MRSNAVRCVLGKQRWMLDCAWLSTFPPGLIRFVRRAVCGLVLKNRAMRDVRARIANYTISIFSRVMQKKTPANTRNFVAGA